jgi:hypothetical protein
MHGANRNVCRVLLRKPEEERLLRKPRHRWKYDIEMDLKEIGWGCMDWINMAQDRDQWQVLEKMVLSLWFS